MIGEHNQQKVYLYLTGLEAKKSNVPFLLNSQMLPITAANAWLRRIAGDGATVSPHTHRTYAYALFDFLSYLASRGVDWREINNDTLIQYRDVQDENLSPHTKRLLNRRTINARIVVVERFYTFACASGFINKNPITYKSIKSLRPVDSDMLAHLGREWSGEVPAILYEKLPGAKLKWLPEDKINDWLNSIESWRDKLIAKLLFHTGMRREECVTLTLADLPSRNSIGTLTPEVSFEITGKGRKNRRIYLTPRDFLDVHDYIKIIRNPLVCKLRSKHNFIFVNRDGSPIRPTYVNQIFKHISVKCGINITPHMMRHSFAVVALQCWKELGLSEPEKLLQARLGHANVATTQIYTHITDERLAEEAHANAALIEHFIHNEAE